MTLAPARLAALALFCALAAPGRAAEPSGRAAQPTQEEVQKIIRTIDARQNNSGDWRALAYMEQKEKGKTDVVYELLVYRRDQEDKQLYLFTKPKSEQGKGYLRLEKNLWFYDPGVGRWERRTERERIGGTDTRRSDLDESKLGVYQAQRILLKVRPGVDVAFPQVRLWVDQASNNILKRQEMALSGKLQRTSYYPRWKKVYSESKKGDVWFPEEMRFYDEIEKGNQTYILIKEIDLRPLEANIFTKAWLESKSR